jgi:hypothetical protein
MISPLAWTSTGPEKSDWMVMGEYFLSFLPILQGVLADLQKQPIRMDHSLRQ